MLSRFLMLKDYMFYLLKFLLLSLVVYLISLISGDFTFKIFNYSVYSTNIFITSLAVVFFYFFVKFVFYFLNLILKIKILKHKVYVKLSTPKALLVSDFKTEKEIVKRIMLLKISKKYKEGLVFTKQYKYFNSRCFSWYLFFLLKNKNKKEFLQLTLERPSGFCLKFLTRFYIPKYVIFKRRFIKNLYLDHPKSESFAYIYAKLLFEEKRFLESKRILSSFLDDNLVIIKDYTYGYFLNDLMIKVETSLNHELPKGLLLKYFENIDFYNEKRKEKVFQ